MIEILVEGKKRYNIQFGVGKAKYTISFHDGKKSHRDGSDFFDMKIFKNKPDFEKYEKELKSKGYVKEDMSTSSAVDMNPTGKPKKKKREIFNVSDECFHKFRHGKTKFERWSRYLDLEDASQKKIYDWAKKHHNGTIILQNSVTGQVRGIRYNRTGGGQWGKITRVKEQVLQTNQKFKVK